MRGLGECGIELSLRYCATSRLGCGLGPGVVACSVRLRATRIGLTAHQEASVLSRSRVRSCIVIVDQLRDQRKASILQEGPRRTLLSLAPGGDSLRNRNPQSRARSAAARPQCVAFVVGPSLVDTSQRRVARFGDARWTMALRPSVGHRLRAPDRSRRSGLGRNGPSAAASVVPGDQRHLRALRSAL